MRPCLRQFGEYTVIDIALFDSQIAISSTSDVTIQADPFIIGSSAVATCSSNVEQVNVDSIVWMNAAREILASVSSSNQLELVFNQVNDSQSLHGAEFTCRLRGTRGAEVTRSFQVSLIGECTL